MRYRFTGIRDAPQYEPGLLSKYNNTVLDEIDGITTLRVEGRTSPSRSFDLISTKESEIDVLVGSKYKPVKLSVIYQVVAKNELSVEDVLQRFLHVFDDHPGRLRFSDVDYYYETSLENIKADGIGLTKILTCDFLCLTPYIYKDLYVKGNLFDINTDYPTSLDKITLTVAADNDFLEIRNSRTNAKMLLRVPVKAGEVITIEPSKFFAIWRGAQNLMPYLDPKSELEAFELAFLDRLESVPECNIELWAKARRLG
ncbi:MAG: hypothetical protein SPK23_01340 [Eubacteriales bacterium]|nr:hypothetical protein [Eubacteriales bacterium]